MLTHVVMIRFVDDATDGQVAALVEGLRALPDQIPEIRSYTVGRDMGLVDGNCDLAVVGQFASAADLRTYLDHPAHVALVADLLEPVSASRTRIQFPSPDREP
ncbi:MAG TPA: Dabb family protein [Acidimicrobiales bacterium]|nr:Dabb family protein [Acidimicrobiales bacterium]